MIQRRLAVSTVFILAAALVMAVAATFLPDNPYQRFQLLKGTMYAAAQGFYERMHFDPRPIDVAILGDSRTALGLRASRIEEDLARAGTPARVVNMSMVGDGRNTQWLLVRELLATKSPKVIVLAVNNRPHPWGHETFRYLASPSDIWREAGWGLHDLKKNLAYLPYRQMTLFGAMIAPDLFGLNRDFDAAHYAPNGYDMTRGHTTDDGRFVSSDQRIPREVLLKEGAANAWRINRHSKLPQPLRRITDADDRTYTDLIAEAARRKGVKLLFVYLPEYEKPLPLENRGYYEAHGRVETYLDLASHDELYIDWGHLNAAGTLIASDRTAAAISALMQATPAASR
jgi:hypothetical protein